MKLNDIKHNHSLTDLLKILIFSILMMIPFIDVATRCLYVICNKNAYQSYSGNVMTTYNEAIFTPTNTIQSVNDIIENNYYSIILEEDYFPTITRNTTITTGLGNSIVDKENNYIGNYVVTYAYNNTYKVTQQSLKCLMPYTNTTQDVYVRLIYQDNPMNTYYNVFKIVDKNTFINQMAYIDENRLYVTSSSVDYYVGTLVAVLEENRLLGYEPVQIDSSALDNVFIYSVNQISQSELYTWTQQTAIYTGIQTMTTQLGINNTVIPILLVYWFILSVIYIIIDIILKLFTILTHAIGSKTT